MITVFAYLILVFFLIGQIALVFSFPLVAFLLNIMLGLLWCYQPKK